MAMAAREDLGSWLEGPRPGAGGPASGGPAGHLGLPASGPGSFAPLGRRIGALAVDWLVCLLISGAFFAGAPIATLAIFAAENLLLVGTLGHTLGHRLLGIHVRRAGAAGPAGLVRAALRTLLLCLVLPAAITGGDGRGMHDRAAGTLVVRI